MLACVDVLRIPDLGGVSEGCLGLFLGGGQVNALPILKTSLSPRLRRESYRCR